MKNNHWIKITLLLLFANTMLAQVAMLEKKVTIQYFDVELEDALENISKAYDVNFTYSVDRISVNQRVSVDVENAPLSMALEDLLEETDITYASIGDQVILKVDKEKRRLLSERKLKKKTISKEAPQPKVVKVVKPYVSPVLPIGFYKNRTTEIQTPLISIKMETAYDPDFYFSPAEELEEEMEIFGLSEDGERFAQISIIGGVGTNGSFSSKTTNKISLNILWGKNGGVNGTEVGGLSNKVVNDVKGVQIAGLGNAVGGNVDGVQVAGLRNKVGGKVNGTQVGGLYNSNKGETKGVQVGGLLNTTKEMNGIQVAGLINVAKNSSKGFQVAGIGNVAGKSSESGMQIGGVFNINKGKTNSQVAPVFNYGKDVRGTQIGLINIADTISGASIGLINIVKKGYNRLEISGADLLYFNAELKLGSRRFYNIFHAGFRPINDQEGHYAYGYGFGTIRGKKGARWSHNFELLATQVNDIIRTETIGGPTNINSQKLNLLSQFRWSIDFRLGRRTSIFLGPTFNVMTSKIVEPSGEYGLDILPYTIFESKNTGNNPTYVAGWIGFNAGLRF